MITKTLLNFQGESENDVTEWIQTLEAAKLQLSESEQPVPPSPLKGDIPELDIDNDDDGEQLYVMESKLASRDFQAQTQVYVPLLMSNMDEKYAFI